MMDRNEISVVNVCKNEHICLELFQVWVLNFSLKDEQPSSKCGWISAFCNIFYMQGLGTCFVHTGILAWHLFSLGLFKLFFEGPWNFWYSTVSCCLMGWPAKDISVFHKPLAFEKRMNLFLSSPKWNGSLLYKYHWHSNENSLFKTFSILLVENTLVICIVASFW